MPHYVYLIKYIHPTSQQGLTRPAGSPGSSTLLLGEHRCLQLDKELKFLWIHRNLPLQPPLVKVCTLLAGHSQGHCVSSLSCAQGRSIKAQMRDWSQTNFYKIQKQHHFTWFLWTWLLWSPRHHALENKAVSALFRFFVRDMGFWRGEPSCSCPLLLLKKKTDISASSWKSVSTVLQFREQHSDLMYSFLYISASQQSNTFSSWKRSSSLSQQVWLRGKNLMGNATTILLWLDSA